RLACRPLMEGSAQVMPYCLSAGYPCSLTSSVGLDSISFALAANSPRVRLLLHHLQTECFIVPFISGPSVASLAANTFSSDIGTPRIAASPAIFFNTFLLLMFVFIYLNGLSISTFSDCFCGEIRRDFLLNLACGYPFCSALQGNY